jgi:hypothetical protein
MPIMHYRPLLSVGVVTAAALVVLTGLSGPASAQASAAAAAPPIKPLPLELKCNPNPLLPAAGAFSDPFVGSLSGPTLPAGNIPVGDQDRSLILNSDLPCQEKVSATGPEAVGLENLQRGFDFYSWRTFIALNAPDDGMTPIDHAKPDMRTRWENMDNFKQLLDVMLPARMQPPKWPTDKAGMEAERERLVPVECQDEHKKHPDWMIVQMIEESFNEPFKTGPLIDQQGRYAIFDILMNRQMFNYISDHHLYSKDGQQSAANSGLAVDFPVGQNSKDATPTQKAIVADTGAFMLKVSWKILGPDEPRPDSFHQVKALVLMPPPIDPKTKRLCLTETLGLIGFHAVHKTASRPQWIWTSFEHVRNVPDKDEVAARKFDGPYNFFNANCKDNCPEVNATPPRRFWQPDPALPLEFKDATFKSQVVRETPLTDAAKNMNKIFHSMLKGTVWENYMLLSTQWPSLFAGCTSLHSVNPAEPLPGTDFQKQPDMNCSPAPTYFANSTLETYSQGEIPLASSSCIACHGNAVSFQTSASNQKPGELRLNQSDFTFILEKAQ